MSNWEKRTAADGLATCADELAAAHAEAVKSDKAFSAVSAELAKARAEVEQLGGELFAERNTEGGDADDRPVREPVEVDRAADSTSALPACFLDEHEGQQHARAGMTGERGRANTHPTVKPTELMQWLVRLVTPPNGLVLDPFAGSGTTGVACIREGLRFLGFELEEAHCEIARGRIREATLQPRRPLGSPELKRGKVDDRQLGLFGRTA